MRLSALRVRVLVLGLAGAGALGFSAVLPGPPAVASGAAHGRAVRAAAAAPRPAGFLSKPRPLRLPRGVRLACPQPATPGQMQCLSLIRGLPPGHGAAAALDGPAVLRAAALTPRDLRRAYRLSSASRLRGHRETVAIVDAYGDPRAAADLARYRAYFRLPACPVSSGCLRIVSQSGRARPLPGPNTGWALEQSLDLDMVSAICPNCRILLVEARSDSISSLGSAENTAVRMGARFVSNSWGGSEFGGQDRLTHYFNHPGAAIVFSSGDSGYGLQYPADTQFVTSVGGTTLRRDRSARRGWTETAWGSGVAGAPGSGSGCSAQEPKPSWQWPDSTSAGCLTRTDNDVAAAADPATGAAVYDTYRTPGQWQQVGGTSEAAPIITAVYALSGNPRTRSYPAAYPYAHAGSFFDITLGADGSCGSARQYLCQAEAGYDGPTGLGSPDGIGGFSHRGVHRVTLVDPGTQALAPGAAAAVRITGLDTSTSSRPLAYRARGLPPGLQISAVSGSTDAVITGTLPAVAGSWQVSVTARDRTTWARGRVTFAIVTGP